MNEEKNVSESAVMPEAEEEIIHEEETEKKSVKDKVKDFIKKAISPENVKKTICIALGIAVVLVGAFFLIKSRTPAGIAKRYAKASVINDNAVVGKLVVYDLKEIIRVSPPYTYSSYWNEEDRPDDEDLFEKCSDYYEEDISSWNELYAVQKKSRLANLEDEFGKFKISVDVTRVKDLSEKKAKSGLADWLNVLEKIGFDTDAIKECKQITVKIKLIGEDDTDKETMLVYLCKKNGSWKVVDHDYGS